MSLDHFKFYRLRETETDLDVSISVGLQGTFDEEIVTANLGELVLLGNPVDKNDEGIIDRDAHMLIYEFDLHVEEPARNLVVSNQFFSETRLTIGHSVGLMVPAQKIIPGNHDAPEGLDHYKMYRVTSGITPEVPVTLSDQFVNDNNEVGPPVAYGVPTVKVHDGNTYPVGNPLDTLVIYQIRKRNTNIPIKVKDQFGTYRCRTRKAFFLAVPTALLEWDGPVVHPT